MLCVYPISFLYQNDVKSENSPSYNVSPPPPKWPKFFETYEFLARNIKLLNLYLGGVMAESLIIIISNFVMIGDAESECTYGCLYSKEEFKSPKFAVHWIDILASSDIPF
jgi:hypothetical protein